MPYVLIALLFGIAGGIVGRLKGSSFFVWFLISAVIPVLGLIAAVLYRSERDEMRRICPECSAVVKLQDAVCMRCGRDLDFPEELIAPQSWGRPVAEHEARDRDVPAAVQGAGDAKD